jgi:hypothetical protein
MELREPRQLVWDILYGDLCNAEGDDDWIARGEEREGRKRHLQPDLTVGGVKGYNAPADETFGSEVHSLSVVGDVEFESH